MKKNMLRQPIAFHKFWGKTPFLKWYRCPHWLRLWMR